MEDTTMPTLSRRLQLLIALLLAGLLFATRFQPWASYISLPGASWAVFFLAGVYLPPAPAFAALFTLGWLIDLAPHLASGASLAETLSGARAFCLTPAYFFLLPAYGALTLAGRWYAAHHRDEADTLLRLTAAVIGGAAICELISSGSFYFFSGRFAEPTLLEFGARLAKYFPAYLGSMAFYVALAAFVHAGLVLSARAARLRGARL
jgi:hypothetical protein